MTTSRQPTGACWKPLLALSAVAYPPCDRFSAAYCPRASVPPATLRGPRTGSRRKTACRVRGSRRASRIPFPSSSDLPSQIRSSWWTRTRSRIPIIGTGNTGIWTYIFFNKKRNNNVEATLNGTGAKRYYI